jgi:hypothetical protein
LLVCVFGRPAQHTTCYAERDDPDTHLVFWVVGSTVPGSRVVGFRNRNSGAFEINPGVLACCGDMPG